MSFLVKPLYIDVRSFIIIYNGTYDIFPNIGKRNSTKLSNAAPKPSGSSLRR